MSMLSDHGLMGNMEAFPLPMPLPLPLPIYVPLISFRIAALMRYAHTCIYIYYDTDILL